MYKSKYFNDSELKCKCCGVNKVSEDFLKKLDALREDCGFPFPITSAYRCPKHNAAVSSTGVTGPHTTGRAVDVGVQGERALVLMQKAIEHGFTGIGVAQKGSSRFIHIDDLEAPKYPRPNCWSY